MTETSGPKNELESDWPATAVRSASPMVSPSMPSATTGATRAPSISRHHHWTTWAW